MWSWFFNETSTSSSSSLSSSSVKLISAELKNENQLPALPFVYSRHKPRLFICKHPDFIFASIITDMDYQLLNYVAKNCSDYVAKIMDCTSTSDEMADIVSFTTLFESADRVYDGLFNVGIMDFLNAVKPDKCAKFLYTKLLENVTVHFTAWYAPDPDKFAAEGLKFTVSETNGQSN